MIAADVTMKRTVLICSTLRTTSAVDPLTAPLDSRRRESSVSMTQMVSVPAITE